MMYSKDQYLGILQNHYKTVNYRLYVTDDINSGKRIIMCQRIEGFYMNIRVEHKVMDIAGPRKRYLTT